MMACLLLLMLILAVNSITLPNSAAGLKYYLYPDFNRVLEHGIREVVFAAMGQAFFTLSLGIGALAIFGSYIGKEQRLTGEAMWIMALDTFVAIVSGLIIFPACFSFGINPDKRSEPAVHHPPQRVQRHERRPYLGYSVLPVHAFRSHVYSNRCIRKHYLLHLRFNRLGAQKTIRFNIIAIILLSLPCVLGFNLWGHIQPLGKGTCILDLEDFLVSNNLLPLGSLIYLSFCTSRYGWGWNNFIAEADTGKGIPFPKWIRFYATYILPLVVLYIFFNGYYAMFVK